MYYAVKRVCLQETASSAQGQEGGGGAGILPLF